MKNLSSAKLNKKNQKESLSALSAFIDSIKHLKLLFHYLGPYRKGVRIGLAALLLVDLLEILPPLILMKVVDVLQRHLVQPLDNLHWEVLKWVLFSGALTLIQAWCRYAWRMYLIRSSFWAGRDLRNEYLGHLVKLSPRFYDKNKLGTLMSHATTDIDAVRMAMGPGVLVFFDALFYLLFLPAAMIAVHPKMGALALSPLLFLPFLSNAFQSRIQKGFDRVQEKFSELSSIAQEGILSVRLLKVFNAETKWTQRFSKAGNELQKESVRLAWVNQGFGPALEFFTSVSLVLVLAVSLRDPRWGITLGMLVAFQRYIQKLIWPMNAIGMCLGHLQKSIAAYERIEAVLEKKSEIISGLVTSGDQNAPMIEARNLSFRYSENKPWALENITFQIPQGKWIGLTGPIGSGKSTLLSLLLRFYPVGRGQLYVQGVDVNDWNLSQLRGKMEAWAPQEPIFFSESIQENLDWGNKGVSAGLPHEGLENPYWKALAEASLEPEIKRLPDQLQTRLGERGWTLSGGQRQRLALARVFLSQRPLVLLDDVFSAMDQDNERKLIEGLKQKKQKGIERTLLLCSHRIPGLLLCDSIFYFESGRLVEKIETEKLLASFTNEGFSPQRYHQDHHHNGQGSRLIDLLEMQKDQILRSLEIDSQKQNEPRSSRLSQSSLPRSPRSPHDGEVK